MRKIIAFIGGGNMTNCLATALIKKGYPTDCIIVSSRDQTKLTDLTTRLSLKMAKTNSEAIADADIVILAVKPSVIKTVCEETAAAIAIKKPLIISLATGINVTSMATWLGNDKLGIVRTMSNTPTKVGLGMTVLFANEAVTEEQRKDIENIF
ncbi:MAG TPA: NAD(P)-binding domain-containing protein, partial [Coxiellaceae bacterium]|nr:NAD(P)-binding domain-containing protein [Coxiellaceae bacterium]